MANELLERITGYHRHPPFFPFFFEEVWHRGLFRRELQDRWGSTCREVGLSNQVEELHAVRNDYLQILHAYSLILKGMALLAPEANGRYPKIEWLLKDLEDVQRLHDELTTRWVTLDDLYAIVAEYVSPIPERAEALATKFAPPQAWYDEDADPFTPAE